MRLGTHNSGTGGRLVWWLRPFAWLINLTSRCQSRSIAEQLNDGVRLFNLQITHYRGGWHFSHGLAIYREKLGDALETMRAAATDKEPIYFQLYLDKNFFLGQEKEEFRELVKTINEKLCSEKFVMLTAWIEGSDEYPHRHLDTPRPIIEEHYWTMTWAKSRGKSSLDYLPLPRRWARKHNDDWKQMLAYRDGYLMLDFYEI